MVAGGADLNLIITNGQWAEKSLTGRRTGIVFNYRDIAEGGDAGKISIDEIIDSIYTSLPTPKIAPETAKLTEIKSYMDNIDTIIDRIISEDMIPNGGSDQELKDAVASLKAFYKSKLTQEFAEKVGIVISLNSHLLRIHLMHKLVLPVCTR